MRLIGSKTNGVLCPPFGPLAGTAGRSNFAKSTSRAMAFRKATAWDERQLWHTVCCIITFGTHRLGMPSPTSEFKPTQMAATTRRAHYNERILLDLLVRHRLIDRNRIIFRVDSQHWDPYCKHTIRTTRIPVVRALGGVTPSRALDFPVKLMKVLERHDTLFGEGSVLEDLVAMGFEEPAHIIAHGFAVDVQAEPRALKGEGGDLELPGVGDDYGGGEEAGGAFFSDVLRPGNSVRTVN